MTHDPNRRTLRAIQLVLESPRTDEDIWIHHDERALRIKEIQVVIKGSGSPSLTWNIAFDADRSAAGTDVFAADQTTTNTTTGDTLAAVAMANPDIPAGNHVRLTTSASAGSVEQLNISVKMA